MSHITLPLLKCLKINANYKDGNLKVRAMFIFTEELFPYPFTSTKVTFY